MACAWRDRMLGIHDRMPLLDGRLAPYIHLDNAASTPPLAEVADAVQRFLPYYSSVHRGTGFKSRVSTALYDEARDVIARFVSAEPEDNMVIFGKNTTEAINKLAHRYPFRPGDVVLSTALEHHSNDLPWRTRAELVRARVTPDGKARRRRLRRAPAGLRRARGARHGDGRVERDRRRAADPSPGPQGARRRAPGSWWMPRSWRRTGGST